MKQGVRPEKPETRCIIKEKQKIKEQVVINYGRFFDVLQVSIREATNFTANVQEFKTPYLTAAVTWELNLQTACLSAIDLE